MGRYEVLKAQWIFVDAFQLKPKNTDFAVVRWRSGIRAGDSNKRNKIIKKAGSVTDCKLDISETVVEKRSLSKLLSIMHRLLDRQL